MTDESAGANQAELASKKSITLVLSIYNNEENWHLGYGLEFS
jgi:hypothetical protein